MPDATLLLRLAGPSQCWDGHRQPYTAGDRWPRVPPLPLDPRVNAPEPPGLAGSPLRLYPTHSGVTGLLAAAAGRSRGEDVSDLDALTVHVRVDQPGVARGEFRTSRKHVASGRAVTAPQAEFVVDDAVFVAAVTGERDVVWACAQALSRPRFPLGLGRREHPVTLPLRLGVVDGGGQDALRATPWVAARWYRERGDVTGRHDGMLRIVQVGRGTRWTVTTVVCAPVAVADLPPPGGQGALDAAALALVG